MYDGALWPVFWIILSARYNLNATSCEAPLLQTTIASCNILTQGVSVKLTSDFKKFLEDLPSFLSLVVER